MSTDESTLAWPLEVEISTLGETASKGAINIWPGITTLVGPNGSGKTRALRALKNVMTAPRDHTGNRKTHFLASGRCSPFESYRAAIDHPNGQSHSDAAIGSSSQISQWWHFESVTGILLELDRRADLRLKIEARLQQLFDRSVKLSWSQEGLKVHLSPMSGGDTYSASHEASGILQLVALLAAIHNDEIGALLIDEPEISLHPQHQAFLLEEMEKVAGDPSDPTKKLIVIATHSASLLPLRRIEELSKIVFFNSVHQLPAQIPDNDGILKRKKLLALIARLSATHRMAMFAEHLLLVEGPSDEIITTQLGRQLDLRLLARNAQILPVAGKGEFAESAKLFRLMGKKVAVLADLDALADNSDLVRHFSDLPQAAAVATDIGRQTLADLDGDTRSALESFMNNHKSAVDESAKTYRDWSSKESSDLAPRRVSLARLLTDPDSFGGEAVKEAVALKTRYEVLLGALAKLGCFFLRRGAIENYYASEATDQGKPDLAVVEATRFESSDATQLESTYADVVAALTHIAPNQRVDEDKLLRPKLAAVLAAVVSGSDSGSSDQQLNQIAKAIIGPDAEVFSLSKSLENEQQITVDIASQLFKRPSFPFDMDRSDNLTVVVSKKLPGIK